MKQASLILSTSNQIPSSVVNRVIEEHRKQTIDLEIIVSNYGIRKHEFISDVFVYTDSSSIINLSRMRNNGARVSSSEWLIFSDIDTVYEKDLFETMLYIGKQFDFKALAGRTRLNYQNINSKIPCSHEYRCSNSPMVVNRNTFINIGGYCEKYHTWGYEDDDFAYKIGEKNLYCFDSKSKHIMEIHNFISANKEWNHGSDANKQFFLNRKKVGIANMVIQDYIDFQNKKIVTNK